MSDKVSVVIAMPLIESVKMQTVMSLLGMISMATYPIDVVFVKDSSIHEARKSSVIKAREIGASHIFFFDSDMSIDYGAINKLLSYQKDIVGVNYHAKHIPIESVIKFQDENGKVVQTEVPQNSLFRCYAIGTGACLISMDVFNRIEEPWFFYESSSTLVMSDDVWFCRQAQRAGIDVFCSSEIVAKHIGDYEY